MRVVDTDAEGWWLTQRIMWPGSSVIDVRENEIEGCDTLYPNKLQATKETRQ